MRNENVRPAWSAGREPVTTRRSRRSARPAPSSSVYAGYGDLALRTRSVKSFVAKLKPRDVQAVGAEQLHQQIGLLRIASRRVRTEAGHPMTEAR